VGPEERPCRTAIDAQVNFSNQVPREFWLNGEPIAQVAFRTDRIPTVGLAGVVEGNHVRICNEGCFVLVLDFDGRSGKDKEAVLGRLSRLMEQRMIRAASESPNPDEPTLKHHLANLAFATFQLVHREITST
jgi:hypothetical protein